MAMRVVAVLALLLGLSASGIAWADSQSTQSNQVTMVFRNISGSTQPSGTVMIFDYDDTDRNFDCGFKGCHVDAGYFVETTTTADSDDVAGVLLSDTCPDDCEGVFVVEGPALVRWAGVTDNTNTLGVDVGTTTLAGRAGSGTLLGITISNVVTAGGTEVNGFTDEDTKWIWVDPDRN